MVNKYCSKFSLPYEVTGAKTFAGIFVSSYLQSNFVINKTSTRFPNVGYSVLLIVSVEI